LRRLWRLNFGRKVSRGLSRYAFLYSIQVVRSW
jgi:hypothetical protein